MNRLPISGVVVSCNEGHLLAECLESIRFCKELILVDLESEDNTLEIGENYVDQIISHHKVPVVEYIRSWIRDKVKYDWILFVDPDEIYPKSLYMDLSNLFENGVSETIASVKLPWQFYFGSYPLKGTNWGGAQYKEALRHRHRNLFSEDVHRDMKNVKGYKVLQIDRNTSNAIEHKWMQNYSQLIRKHRRYIGEEGKSLFNEGKRYSVSQHIKATYFALKYSYKIRNGYKDGFVGLGLSLFWSWYTFSIWLSLKKYELATA